MKKPRRIDPGSVSSSSEPVEDVCESAAASAVDDADANRTGPQPLLREARLSYMAWRFVAYLLSGAMVLGTLVLLSTRGLNWGVEFRGGSVYQFRFADPGRASAEAVRAAFDRPEVRSLLPVTSIQELERGEGAGETVDYLVFAGYQEQAATVDPLPEVEKRLSELGEVDCLSTYEVGPTIGASIQRDALVSILLACLGMLAYMAIRFEFDWGMASVLALVHDCLAVLGVFSLLGWEVNGNFLAALLTIIGYSLNDSIVVMDRVRENLGNFRLVRRLGRIGVFDLSIDQSLTRTINTSLTTLFPILTLLLLGGANLRDFAVALLVGVVVGTYSSIFIVSALLVDWDAFRKERSEHS